MNLKRFIICVFLCLLLVSLCQAEIIYLKDGTTIKGTIVKSLENSITIKTSFGEISIEKDKVSRIEYEEKPVEEKPKTEPVKVEVEKPVHVKVEKVHKHFLIGYTREVMPIELLDAQEKIEGFFNCFGLKYFIFPDVSFGSEFKTFSGDFEPGSSIKFKGSIIEVMGTKYSIGKAWGAYLSAGLGFVVFKVTPDEVIETRIQGINFALSVGIVRAIGDTLFIVLPLGYTSPIKGEFETLDYEDSTYPEIQLGGFVYGLGLSVKF